MQKQQRLSTLVTRIAVIAGLTTLCAMFSVRANFASARPGSTSLYAQPTDPMGEEETDQESTTEKSEPLLRKLSDAEVHRIRYMELRPLRMKSDKPDRVTVKIPQETVDEFLLDMEGHPDFEGEKTRRLFRAMTPPQKLHEIARYKGDAYMDKVEILSDPEIFVEFRRNVMPVVLRGCSTSGCHAPNFDEELKFGLYKDPKRSSSTTYANFVILNDLVVDDMPMINRAHPGDSLILTYLLPVKDVKPAMRHPGDPLNPVYQSRTAPGFRRIEKWIGSLRQPNPDYQVHLLPTRAGPSPETPPGPPPEPEEKAKPEDSGNKAPDRDLPNE